MFLRGLHALQKIYELPLSCFSKSSISFIHSNLCEASIILPRNIFVQFFSNNYLPKEDRHHHNVGVESAPSPVAIAGLRHVVAPETKPQPSSPQLPPGQNVCADCERLIV